MAFETFVQAVSTVGFPIACCVVLFIQNNKLTETINDLKSTLIENTTLLKVLSESVKGGK